MNRLIPPAGPRRRLAVGVPVVGMLKSIVPISLLFALHVTPVRCDEEEMDTDLMQTIDDTTKSVTSNIDLKRDPAADQDARDLQKLLGQVQAFYLARQDKPDAIEFARTSLELANQLQRQIGAHDFTAAALTANALSRSCRSCHDVYKQS